MHRLELGPSEWLVRQGFQLQYRRHNRSLLSFLLRCDSHLAEAFHRLTETEIFQFVESEYSNLSEGGRSGFVILKTRRNGMAKCDTFRMVTFAGPNFVRPWCH